jgi:release factor glutamine methyltransferase
LAPELTIRTAQAQARKALLGISPTSSLDAQLVLADVLDRPRAWVLAHPEARLGRVEQTSFAEALARLAAGEPLAYVLGWWEFYGRRFRLTPAVLIPRPETELLVETALDVIRRDRRPKRVVEVGTGSGCVAVTLAAEVPDLRLIAGDVSALALRVCKENLRLHGVEHQVDLVQSDLVESLAGPVDLVLGNLPYIPSASLDHLAVARGEPALALDGGSDGLEHFRRLLRQLRSILGPDAVVFLEIGAEQGPRAMDETRAAFPSASVRVLPDLAGRDRLVTIKLGRGD